MNMATSDLIQLNPEVKILHTTKKFYDQYLCKILIYAPGGRSMLRSGDIAEHLEWRSMLQGRMGGAIGWLLLRGSDLENASPAFLDVLRTLKKNSSLNLKFRIEEPHVQIYAETPRDLKTVMGQLVGYHNYVKSVCLPESDLAEEVLNSGKIIRRADTGYQYKITLRDGHRYDAQTLVALKSFLEAQGDEVRVSEAMMRKLSKTHGFLYSCYFYARDPVIVNFINLIHPDLVANIHELVVLEHK
jgi:hypothetical protein